MELDTIIPYSGKKLIHSQQFQKGGAENRKYRREL